MDDSIHGQFVFRGTPEGEKRCLEPGSVYELTCEKIPRISRLSGYVKWRIRSRALVKLDDTYACAVHYRDEHTFDADWERA
jgi:hypothetical protein